MTTNDKWANTEANKRAYVNAQMLAGEQLGYLRRTNRRKRGKRLFKSLVFGKPEGAPIARRGVSSQARSMNATPTRNSSAWSTAPSTDLSPTAATMSPVHVPGSFIFQRSTTTPGCCEYARTPPGAIRPRPNKIHRREGARGSDAIARNWAEAGDVAGTRISAASSSAAMRKPDEQNLS